MFLWLRLTKTSHIHWGAQRAGRNPSLVPFFYCVFSVLEVDHRSWNWGRVTCLPVISCTSSNSSWSVCSWEPEVVETLAIQSTDKGQVARLIQPHASVLVMAAAAEQEAWGQENGWNMEHLRRQLRQPDAVRNKDDHRVISESCSSGQVTWHLRQDGRLQHLSQLAEFQVQCPIWTLTQWMCSKSVEIWHHFKDLINILSCCHVAPSVSMSRTPSGQEKNKPKKLFQHVPHHWVFQFFKNWTFTKCYSLDVLSPYVEA